MSELRLRKKIIIDIKLNLQKKEYEGYLSKIKNQMEKLDKTIQGGIKGLLGKSYWEENDIKRLYRHLGIKEKLVIEMSYFMNAINLYFYYYRMPTIMSIFLFKESRDNFLKMLNLMIKKGNYGPMGLYILGRVVMNDNTLVSNISEMQPKFVVDFLMNIPSKHLQIISEIGLRLITKLMIEKFLRNKIKMDG